MAVAKPALLGFRLVLLITLVLSGCRNGDKVSIPFQTVIKDDQPRAHNSAGLSYAATHEDLDLLMVANTQEAQQVTNTLWQQPGLRFDEITDIDYKAYWVLVAYLGAYGRGGAKITIEEIIQTGHTIDVIVSTFEPTVGDAVITHPIHVVKIKKEDLRITGNVTINLVQEGEKRLTKEYDT